MRHIGRRYSIEDGSIMTPTSTIFDLSLKYLWRRYEFFVQLQNLANTKWRGAEHAFESRTAGEVAGRAAWAIGFSFHARRPIYRQSRHYDSPLVNGGWS